MRLTSFIVTLGGALFTTGFYLTYGIRQFRNNSNVAEADREEVVNNGLSKSQETRTEPLPPYL